MIAELVRDLLWARANVMISAGWKTRPAWRYVRYCARHAGIPIPFHLRRRISRGHYARLARRYEPM